MSSLLEKITNHTAKLCVIGLGQVGIPVALSFCKEGFTVYGYDNNETRISLLKNHQSPINESNIQKILSRYIQDEKFLPTSNIETVSDLDVFIVCVPTPISDELKPNLTFLQNVCDTISEFKLENKLVVIESSIPPKTFESLVMPTLTKKNKNFYVSYVPERMSPGQAFNEISTISRVIAGIDEESSKITKALYGNVIRSDISFASPIVAEICKLVENTFRDVNVALANEVALICEIYGIDVLEVQEICNSHPRVNLLSPGPGVGGPCLPKDPYLLLTPPGTIQINSDVITHARKVNDSMPFHVIDLVRKSLKQKNKDINNSKITVWGVTYKANIKDTRNSPAEVIITKLLESGGKVIVNDPKTEESFKGISEPDVLKSIEKSDVLLILTDHDDFKKLDLSQIKIKMNENPILIDTRRVFKKDIAEKMDFDYMSIGCISKN